MEVPTRFLRFVRESRRRSPGPHLAAAAAIVGFIGVNGTTRAQTAFDGALTSTDQADVVAWSTLYWQRVDQGGGSPGTGFAFTNASLNNPLFNPLRATRATLEKVGTVSASACDQMAQPELPAGSQEIAAMRAEFRKAMLDAKIETDVSSNTSGSIEHANLILPARLSWLVITPVCILVLSTALCWIAATHWCDAHSSLVGRCRNCGYHGLAGRTCPECGHAHEGRGRARIASAAVLIGLALAGASALLSPYARSEWLDHEHASPTGSSQRPSIVFRAGEVVWLRWATRQCYLCVVQEVGKPGSPTTTVHTRLVLAEFDSTLADVDPAGALVREISYSEESGEPPVRELQIAGKPATLRLPGLVDGWSQLTLDRPEEFVRYPNANNGASISYHVWLLAHGQPSPYSAPSPSNNP